MRNIACGFVVLLTAAVTASGARADIINGGFENGTYLDAGGFAVPNGWVASNWDTGGPLQHCNKPLSAQTEINGKS